MCACHACGGPTPRLPGLSGRCSGALWKGAFRKERRQRQQEEIPATVAVALLRFQVWCAACAGLYVLRLSHWFLLSSESPHAAASCICWAEQKTSTTLQTSSDRGPGAFLCTAIVCTCQHCGSCVSYFTVDLCMQHHLHCRLSIQSTVTYIVDLSCHTSPALPSTCATPLRQGVHACVLLCDSMFVSES